MLRGTQFRTWSACSQPPARRVAAIAGSSAEARADTACSCREDRHPSVMVIDNS